MFEVVISGKATKTSKKLPDHDKRKVVEFLSVLRENPVPADHFDLKKMRGRIDTFRARVGDVRVIYEVFWSQRMINVLVIKPREKAYS